MKLGSKKMENGREGRRKTEQIEMKKVVKKIKGKMKVKRNKVR